MFSMWITFSVLPKQRTKLLELLRPIINPTRYMIGCSDSFHFDDEGRNKVYFCTEWHSRKLMNQYIRSRDFRSVLTAMDLCCSPPLIRIYEVCETDGMNYIARVLNRNLLDLNGNKEG